MTSTIKVDNINKVSDGSNIIKKCGSTITVGSGSGQTIVADGATITLGRCGGGVNLASGATQSGFGRTGTVDWCATAKTSPFTATSGDGFFLNTSGGAITVTLPSSPSAGDIVSFADYANTWATACKDVTVCRNGSKINGGCFNALLNTSGQSVTLIYVDGTRGWKNIQDSTSNVTGAPNFINATGGTITTSGDFKIHTFTGDGNFCISTAPTPGNNNVDYLVAQVAHQTVAVAAQGVLEKDTLLLFQDLIQLVLYLFLPLYLYRLKIIRSLWVAVGLLTTVELIQFLAQLHLLVVGKVEHKDKEEVMVVRVVEQEEILILVVEQEILHLLVPYKELMEDLFHPVHMLVVAVVEEPLLLVLVVVADLQAVENFLALVELVMGQKLIQLQAYQVQVDL